MNELTKRQREILDLIQEHMAEEGMPPTRAEISRALGFRSLNAAEEHLRALARKGAIELVPGASRGIRIAQGARSLGQYEMELPLVGRVAAGAPILAQEHVDGHYRFDRNLFQPRPDYLLRVRGMSMRDAGILDGDMLVVQRASEARNGQVVVARLDEEVTVKRFERRRGRVRLLPENPEFQPIVVDAKRQSFTIEGIAVGVIRTGRM